MAKRISNMDELQKALQPVMMGMVDELAKRVYETLWQPGQTRVHMAAQSKETIRPMFGMIP